MTVSKWSWVIWPCLSSSYQFIIWSIISHYVATLTHVRGVHSPRDNRLHHCWHHYQPSHPWQCKPDTAGEWTETPHTKSAPSLSDTEPICKCLAFSPERSSNFAILSDWKCEELFILLINSIALGSWHFTASVNRCWVCIQGQKRQQGWNQSGPCAEQANT